MRRRLENPKQLWNQKEETLGGGKNQSGVQGRAVEQQERGAGEDHHQDREGREESFLRK